MARALNRRRLIISSLLAAIILVITALGLIHLVISTESGVRGFINGEALWSKAQKAAVFHLDRYAETGDPAQLATFRQQMQVSEDGRRARLALTGDPLDAATAAEALRGVGIHPQDIESMISLYRMLGDAPALRDAIAIWEQADAEILRLDDVAAVLEAARAARPTDGAVIAAQRIELAEVDAVLRPMEERFSATLAGSVREVHALIYAIAGSVLLFTALLLVGAVVWTNRRLVHTEARLRGMFDNAAVGIAQLTPQGEYTAVNDAFAKLLGVEREEVVGRRFVDFTHPEDAERNVHQMQALVSRSVPFLQTEKRYVRADRSVAWVRITASMFESESDSEPYVVTFIEDISESRELREEIHHAAGHDPLTQLANRRSFEQELDDVLAGSRHGDVLCTVLVVDLDQFRLLNDSAGHAAGDDYLRRLARRMRAGLRSDDTIARLDSDQFAVLLRGCGGDQALAVAEKLRGVVEDLRLSWGDHSYQFTASIGSIEIGPDYDGGASTILREADAACYAAKGRGRNRVVRHDADDTRIRGWQGQVQHIQRLRRALEDGGFELYAQTIEPIGDAGTRARHAEVLIRLRDDDGEIIPTGEVLQAAEQFHLAAKLDQWVVENTIAYLASEPEQLGRISMCAINLSGQSLSDERALRVIARAVRRGGVPPHKICFEITETAAVANLEAARHFILRLKKVGCRFSLDDFGSGTSSFGYLKELPVDFIKIDGAFVQNLCGDESNEAIVRSIVTLAKDLGKRTIAEFVEEEAVMNRLVDFGVDYAQGYYISVPKPIADALAA